VVERILGKDRRVNMKAIFKGNWYCLREHVKNSRTSINKAL